MDAFDEIEKALERLDTRGPIVRAVAWFSNAARLERLENKIIKLRAKAFGFQFVNVINKIARLEEKQRRLINAQKAR